VTAVDLPEAFIAKINAALAQSQSQLDDLPALVTLILSKADRHSSGFLPVPVASNTAPFGVKISIM
jgi:hypothetical protein